jgi:hypothetical protein
MHLCIATTLFMIAFGLWMEKPGKIIRDLNTYMHSTDISVIDYFVIVGILTSMGCAPMGGFNLYNNDFSGGLVALGMIAIIQGSSKDAPVNDEKIADKSRGKNCPGIY